jgi:hypothetical protein
MKLSEALISSRIGVAGSYFPLKCRRKASILWSRLLWRQTLMSHKHSVGGARRRRYLKGLLHSVKYAHWQSSQCRLPASAVCRHYIVPPSRGESRNFMNFYHNIHKVAKGYVVPRGQFFKGWLGANFAPGHELAHKLSLNWANPTLPRHQLFHRRQFFCRRRNLFKILPPWQEHAPSFSLTKVLLMYNYSKIVFVT